MKMKEGSKREESMESPAQERVEKEPKLKIKRPSLKGPGYKHLGHFAKDKHIQRGHNDVLPGLTQNEIYGDDPDGANAGNAASAKAAYNPPTQGQMNQMAVDKVKADVAKSSYSTPEPSESRVNMRMKERGRK